MLTLTHVDRERSRKGIPESGESIGWVLDGTAFVVQNIDQLCVTWLPLFFGQSKFSSFTRKLYRWGFRKINVASIPNGSSYRENALFFGNEHFLRSDKSQLSLMRSVTAAKTRSGTAGPVSRIVPPTSESTLRLGENVPHEVSVDVSRSHPPQILTAPVNAAEDMASLIQQSVNLQTLLALLSSNQAVGGAAFNQPPPLLNSTLADSINPSFIPPPVPPAMTTDMNQMLQQLSVSVSLLRATGAIPTLPPLVPAPGQTPAILPPNVPIMPWWMNGSIPIVAQPPNPLLSYAQVPGLPHIVNAVANLQQQTPQNLAEQERVRGVVDTFVRYCATVQQQQGALRPPHPPPPPPPQPPPSDESRPP